MIDNKNMSVAEEEFKYDGLRGLKKSGGRWISPVAAVQGISCEWWTEQAGAIVHGKSVELRQYDTYDDNDLVEDHDKKPIWEYGNGDMYLGNWEMDFRLKVPVEQGFGVLFNFNPEKLYGLIYIGNWIGGLPHGVGKSYWLETSNTWVKNHYPGSEIVLKKSKGTKGGRDRGVPYIYVGNFERRIKSDDNALVTLKDGTTRRGPWEDHRPVGDWWTQHHDPSNGNPRNDNDDGDNPSSATKLAAAAGKRTTQSSGEKRKENAAAASPTNASEGGGARRRPTAPPTMKKVKHRAPAAAGARSEDSGTTSDSHDDEVVVLESPIEAARRQAVALTEEDLAKRGLRAWLKKEGIGERVLGRDLKMYAERLIEEGLETKEAILEWCTADDIQRFDWMKPFHKRAFLVNVGRLQESKKTRNSTQRVVST